MSVRRTNGSHRISIAIVLGAPVFPRRDGWELGHVAEKFSNIRECA